MEIGDLDPARRDQLEQLLVDLNRGNAAGRGVLLTGAGGSGKTSMLHMLVAELESEGRGVFLVPLRRLSRPDDLGSLVLEAVSASPVAYQVVGRTLHSSAGGTPLDEVVAALQEVGRLLQAPVLIFDGLNETSRSVRVASAIEELTYALVGWKFVIATRGLRGSEFRRFHRFPVVDLSHGDQLSPRLNPTDFSSRYEVELAITRSIEELPKQPRVTTLLEELALAGGRDQLEALAARMQITDNEARDIAERLARHYLVQLEDVGDAVSCHDRVRDAVLALLVISHPFRLLDLEFGAEEAERDELLNKSFVPQHRNRAILAQHRSIVIGARGSGKTAIFRRMADFDEKAGGHAVEIFPVTNAGELLHHVVRGDDWLDSDALRAGWLIAVAATVAPALPDSAPKQALRAADEIRVALGLPARPATRSRRILRLLTRPFGGTTLSMSVGPINLEAKLPTGDSRPGKARVDVEVLLQEADDLLVASRKRVIILVDRIDETFKYDRAKQEAAVQGLLQAESRVSRLKNISVVVFLRTDLFELYDIQEKNKLVSRSLKLVWSEEDWLQVLVRRVLSNESLRWLQERLSLPDGTIGADAALRLLLPAEIEGQPVDRWLIGALRNGNGHVSPRLAVILLYLARDHSEIVDQQVERLPLFSSEAMTRAMTALSELSFSEVINDFKVAPSFVQNCRAHKLAHFTLREVRTLFDESEGHIADQVRLLERLGFLQRVVKDGESGPVPYLQVPDLYTRCWDRD